jgi:hypothetical protein
MSSLSDQVTRKFTDVIELDEWEIHTDTGWERLTDIKQTVEYDVWRLELENGMNIECADNHIVFLHDYQEVFVKDLTTSDWVMTDSGPIKVASVSHLPRRERMYDVAVDSENHRFYSNGILSHNTTVAAGFLLWYAMFVSDSTTLVVSNKGKGASEVMQRVRYAYENLPDHIRAGVVEYNKQSITFDNGSRIIAETTTETSGRGMSLSLIYLDELAFVKPRIAQEFWTSLSPTLSTGGKCIITSTPNNDDDTFAHIWRDATNTYDEFGNATPVGKNGFFAYKAIWNQKPDRDEAWADKERNKIGEEKFRREHACEFVSADETLINPLSLMRLSGIDPLYTAGKVRWYLKPKPGNIYLVSLDPSTGTGRDNAGIQVFELPSMRQAAEWQHNKTPVEGQVRVLKDILSYIKDFGVDDIYWSLENNAIGEAALVVIRDTGEEYFAGEFIHDANRASGQKRRKGFVTTNRTKLEACIRFKHYIETGKMTLHSKPLISELKTFVAHGASYSGKSGCRDDLVMSTILAVRMIGQISAYEDRVFNAINSSVNTTDDRYEDEYDAPYPLFI